MTTYELDPDVVRWGLHLLDNCSLSNFGSRSTVTHCEPDLSHVEYVREGYFQEHANVENDEVIAYALQEEFSRLAADEVSGTQNAGEEHVQASILAQDWLGPSKRHSLSGDGSGHHVTDFSWSEMQLADNPSEKETNKETSDMGISYSYSCPGDESLSVGNLSHSLDGSDEYPQDGEVGNRLIPLVPIPHVPKINGELPSYDEEISDHQRLLQRLDLYDLVELKVQGDGNCQFRSLSDQLYHSSDYHKFVREQVLNQLKSHPEIYEGYVPMTYTEYLKKMSKSGEWGDHVTLQAAADWFGVKIFVMTSFKDTCYIEILPHIQKSERRTNTGLLLLSGKCIAACGWFLEALLDHGSYSHMHEHCKIIYLSFWAEVHYNSIYPEGDQPMAETKKKKKWWMFG